MPDHLHNTNILVECADPVNGRPAWHLYLDKKRLAESRCAGSWTWK